jgi:hypothetical protein
MNNYNKDVIRRCLNEKIEEYCLIIKSDMKKMTLAQIEDLNNRIADLETAREELEGER